MKKFFKDYMELQRQSNKWFKEHWKGYILFSVILTMVWYVPWFYVTYKKPKNNEITNDKNSEQEEA